MSNDVPASVLRLRELRDELRAQSRSLKLSALEGGAFGPEDEYDGKGLKAGIEACYVDLSALLRAPNQLLLSSTHGERVRVAQATEQLVDALDASDFEASASAMDALKPELRSLQARWLPERHDEFLEGVDALHQRAALISSAVRESQDVLDDVDSVREDARATNAEVASQRDDVQVKVQAIDDALSQARASIEEASSLVARARGEQEEVSSILTQANQHADVVEGFADRVVAREEQLDAQETRTKRFDERLEALETERASALEEAQALIDEARRALQYTTAQGLSASFTEQYIAARDSTAPKWWILSSAWLLLSAVVVGQSAFTASELSLGIVLMRFTLVPVLVGAAAFCAAQYTKHRAVVEDYAYKAVLAKSIVGFSEQLAGESSANEEQKLFIQSVLAQIHQDPLRKKRSAISEALSAIGGGSRKSSG